MRTATQQDINFLKSSITNFGMMPAGGKAGNKKSVIEEDEYIEEEFDEVIESDNGSSDSDTSEKQRRFE